MSAVHKVYFYLRDSFLFPLPFPLTSFPPTLESLSYFHYFVTVIIISYYQFMLWCVMFTFNVYNDTSWIFLSLSSAPAPLPLVSWISSCLKDLSSHFVLSILYVPFVLFGWRDTLSYLSLWGWFILLNILLFTCIYFHTDVSNLAFFMSK